MTGIDPVRATERKPASARARSALRDEVALANLHFMEAFRAHDAAGVAACYTGDAMLMPAGRESVSGTTAIAGFWRAAMSAGVAEVRLETAEVEGLGDTAVEVGRYTLAGADGGIVDRGKYVVVWHRVDGRFRLHRDIWTTSIGATNAGETS